MADSINNLPADAPLDAGQRAALDAVLKGLSAPQAAWLSRYLARLGQPETAAGETAPVKRDSLTILYGSESGNAETCAAEAAKAAKAAGLEAKVADMGDYKVASLAGEKNLLVIVSTWGEGDPPETATDFHASVMGEKAPRIDGLNFAVFALGDISYADF